MAARKSVSFTPSAMRALPSTSRADTVKMREKILKGKVGGALPGCGELPDDVLKHADLKFHNLRRSDGTASTRRLTIQEDSTL